MKCYEYTYFNVVKNHFEKLISNWCQVFGYSERMWCCSVFLPANVFREHICMIKGGC